MAAAAYTTAVGSPSKGHAPQPSIHGSSNQNIVGTCHEEIHINDHHSAATGYVPALYKTSIIYLQECEPETERFVCV